MSFPQGPGNGNNPNPNNNRNNGNPFTNPFNRGNNGTNGKGNNNENRPIWQSPWLWGAVLVVMVVLMFQMFAGGGTKTIDTKDGFALINQGKATYAEITDNKQVVRLKLKNDYTKKNADTGKVTNYGKNVQFYYTFAQGLAQVAPGDTPLLSVEHPTGEFSVTLQLDADGALAGCGLLRTARLLFAGEVFIPARVWPREE